MINRKISDTQLVQPVHSLAQMQAELAAMRLEQVVTQLKHLEALQDQGNHQMQDSENLDTLVLVLCHRLFLLALRWSCTG